MSITISKQTLLDILQKAFPIIPLKSTLQILSNFRIIFNKGKLDVLATDLDQSMKIISNIQGEGSFDITINARKIFEIIRELRDGEITISVKDTVLHIETDGAFNCKIAGADSKDFPGVPDVVSSVEFKIHSSLLKTMINKSIFAVAKDESRACLCGVLWEIQPESTGMVATDGHRLGSCFFKENFSVNEMIKCIVSPKSLTNIQKILDDKSNEIIRVSLNEKYITFSTGSITLCSKLIEGPYPYYKKVIPLSNPKESVIERVLLLNAIKRASVLSNQKTHLVKFLFSENSLEISVNNKEIGSEAKERINVIYNSDNHTIGFNAHYLNEILDIIKTDKIKILMNTQISACIICPVYQKDDNKISEDVFLLMPLRIMEN